jgi:hypothetical protein
MSKSLKSLGVRAHLLLINPFARCGDVSGQSLALALACLTTECDPLERYPDLFLVVVYAHLLNYVVGFCMENLRT